VTVPKIVAVSGYKPFELGIFSDNHPGLPYIKKALADRLATLAEEGTEWIIITGQLGVELWAAETVLDLQTEYPSLKLCVLMPFLNQQEKWNENNRELYEFILSSADFVRALSERPYEGPWQFRNKNAFILHKSDCLLIMFDEEKGGSPKYLYEEARKHQEKTPYDIRTIDFYDLQMMAEEEEGF